MRKIRIIAGDVSVTGSLNDTRTADEIWDALPIEASVSTWGEEIYFGIPVHLSEEDGQSVVEEGDLGYWPPGHAFCIFFGKTPASRGSEIRPASPVNVFGQVDGDATVFSDVPAGTQITVEKAEEE
ncbi:MAG: cyclophilin-like fold protein [Anaerolineae bacterium]